MYFCVKMLLKSSYQLPFRRNKNHWNLSYMLSSLFCKRETTLTVIDLTDKSQLLVTQRVVPLAVGDGDTPLSSPLGGLSWPPVGVRDRPASLYPCVGTRRLKVYILSVDSNTKDRWTLLFLVWLSIWKCKVLKWKTLLSKFISHIL